MTTIDFSQVSLEHITTHRVGCKARDEGYKLSSTEAVIDEETQQYLLQYFFAPIKTDELYVFTHTVAVTMNEVYTVAQHMFAEPDDFIESSQQLAKLLYERCSHPNINDGELTVCYFKQMDLDGEEMDAIGIFKSEQHVPFLKLLKREENYNIEHELGLALKGVDKGCIICNVQEEEGYRLLVVDGGSKSSEAQYWKDEFLKILCINNEFQQTNHFLNIAKQFVTEQLPQEYEVQKTEQIDFLKRSILYFKEHDNFDKEGFESEVFVDKELIQSFRNFDDKFRDEHQISIDDTFEISANAVKRQAKVFKSILKLDKNFHIYIHGNTELIEQGTEPDGRKFYKIYYTNEA